jgi:hypothetical protein
MPTCGHKDCERPLYALGWCQLHYVRVRKHGNPEGGNTHAPPEVRFWRGVKKAGPDECWIKTAKRGKYASFQPGGKGSPSVLAHRFAYEITKGPIPNGLIVMHSCDNRRCVNPAHLSVGTHKDNTADMIAKGRHARVAPVGEASGKAVITEADVRMIRASSETNKAIADRLGVSRNTVRGVRIRRTWKHVT